MPPLPASVFILKRVFNFNYRKEMNKQRSVVSLVRTPDAASVSRPGGGHTRLLTPRPGAATNSGSPARPEPLPSVFMAGCLGSSAFV